uniref:CEACAM6_0 protein n=1 Tax=Fopius arisanus TaxID=64838 RepID=A0A0C9RI65_9HYME
MDLIVLLLVILLQQNVNGLKLLSISIPPYTFRGENARLVCSYDLESEKLYSVSWYKDNEEFYKYVPSSDRSQHSYQVEGIEVDHHNSNSQKVILKHVTLDSAGLYKCEVSAEAPSFLSVKGKGYMEVIALPNGEPMITSEEKVYATGDILALNCTSSWSFPPARITWFINGIKVKSVSEMMVTQRDLVSTISSLRLEIGPDHLTEGRIDVRCESLVETSERATEHLQDLRQTHVFVQGRGSLSSPCLPLLMAALITRRILTMD